MTPAMKKALRELTELEADAEAVYPAEIVADRGRAYIGITPVGIGTINDLLRLMAIRDVSDSDYLQRYVISDMGRALLVRPEIEQEFFAALGQGRAITVKDNRIVVLR